MAPLGVCLFFEYANPSCWFLSVGAFPPVAVSSSGGESFHSPRHGDCFSLACVYGGSLRSCVQATVPAGSFHYRQCPHGGWEGVLLHPSEWHFSCPCGAGRMCELVLLWCAACPQVRGVEALRPAACLLENVCMSVPVISTPTLAASLSLTTAAIGPSPLPGCLPTGF